MIRIAIVGTGYIGKLHAQVIGSRMKNGIVVAVTDSVSQKGKAFADEIGAAFHEDI